MKKMILAAALVCGAAFGASAQYTPEQGDFSVEVQFNPFTDNFKTFDLKDMQLQGRYFFTGQDALRFGIGFGVDTDKKTTTGTYPNNALATYESWTKTRNGRFAINLGYERHFFQNGRVDAFAGAGLGFMLNNVLKTTEDLYSEYDLRNDPVYVLRQQKTHNAEGTYSEFRVNLFTGVNFYVYKGLYVGAELGIKVGFKSFPGTYKSGGYDVNGKLVETYPGNNYQWSDKVESDKGPKSTNFLLGTYVQPALRLGWTF